MSWIAIKYAMRCSHLRNGLEVVKGSVKLMLLAIAFQVPKGCYQSEPTSLRELGKLTGLEERQIRRCRRVLVELGELVQYGGGKLSRYELPRMVGPLFAVDPDKMSGFWGVAGARKADKLSGFAGGLRSRKADKMTGFHRDNLSKNALTTCPDPGAGILIPDLSSSDQEITAAEEEQDELQVAAETFLDWFITEYPKQRDGQVYAVEREIAEPVVRELLARGRSVARLQAMAMLMWASSDPWIVSSDYSVHVLRHRAVQLENYVCRLLRRQGAAPLKVVETPADRLARAVRRLRAHDDDSMLGGVCREAAAALETEEADLAQVQSMLLEVARQVVDVAACVAQARSELQQYLPRMPLPQYETALQTRVNRLVLEAANLPDLSVLGEDGAKPAEASA